jgi:hypothetical protein
MTTDRSTTARPARRLSRRAGACLLTMLFLQGFVLLACEGSIALPANTAPRWACASVTPRPTMIKASVPRPTTTPGIDPGTDDTYYQPWEQEYGLPIQTPTPYTKSGNFYLGQRVEVYPLHALVTAQSGPRVGDAQAQIVTIQWRNASGAAIPMDYPQRVRVRAVRGANGAQITSDAWGMDGQALAASGLPAPPEEIPAGESEARVPILTPPGQVEIVEVAFMTQGMAGTTPTPNTELQAGGDRFMRVQWSRGAQQNPPCADPGVVTDYGGGPAGIPNIPAPPGTARVVQIALQQVGKRYVWGAKGPNEFDCSGLTQWSYAQIGIQIPTGTVGQWPGLPPVSEGAMRSGDLVFFDTETGRRTQVSHVGFVTDLNNDGAWDMVHAASPEYGIRMDYDIFKRPYYLNMYMGARTVRY